MWLSGLTHFDFIGDPCRNGQSQFPAISPFGCAVLHRLHGLHSRGGAGQLRVSGQALYLTIKVDLEGVKVFINLWMVQTQCAQLWLQLVTE